MANYQNLVRQAAQRHGLDPRIFTRQIKQESNFDPNAKSPAGALGIAQIMPATAKAWGVNPADPVAALDAAAKNMASYVKQFGSYDAALRAYNAGPGNVEKSKGFAETNAYVKNILGGNNLQSKVGKALTPATSSGVDNKSLALSLLGFGSGGNDPSDPLAMALQGAQQSAKPVAQATPSYGSTPSGGSTGGAISKQSLGRVDQGVDFTGTGPVPAHGDAVVTRVVQHGGPSGWPGGGFVVYKLTSGPAKGRFIYVAENIAPKVKVGQRLRTGQTVAVALGGSPYLETGWAANAQGQTLARNKGHADLHPNRSNTPEGHDFLRFLGLG